MAGVSGSSVPVDDEVDEVQSLQDVIADQEELEDTANAVLGDSDDTNCSYDKVYRRPCTHTHIHTHDCSIIKRRDTCWGKHCTLVLPVRRHQGHQQVCVWRVVCSVMRGISCMRCTPRGNPPLTGPLTGPLQALLLCLLRNFRCDCGNSHFPDGFRCTYCPVSVYSKGLDDIEWVGGSCFTLQQKDKVNLHNQYNHNFEGVYCTCNRPYPDSEDEVSPFS